LLTSHQSYDLYSYSNTTAYVEGHTDIRIINSTVATLTSAGVDLSKVNMGLAAYGRGYTLSNNTCNYIGCPASGLSTAGPCVGETGVMSLTEIQNMVAQTNVTPQYNPATEMMQISYGNQFVAYDDEYTFYLKKQFADANCMGGTMMWSIDLDNGLAKYVIALFHPLSRMYTSLIYPQHPRPRTNNNRHLRHPTQQHNLRHMGGW